MWPFSVFKEYKQREFLLDKMIFTREEKIKELKATIKALTALDRLEGSLVIHQRNLIDGLRYELKKQSFQLKNHKKINQAYIAKIKKE